MQKLIKFLADNFISRFLFANLTRRIFLFNLIGLSIMLSSILYLNIIRNNLIDVRIENLKVEGIIIANAISNSNDDIILFPISDPETLLASESKTQSVILNTIDSNLNFPVNPVRISPLLRNLTHPTRTRARIYDNNGNLIIDAKHLYDKEKTSSYRQTIIRTFFKTIENIFTTNNMPIHMEYPTGSGLNYMEVKQALAGNINHTTRQTEHSETIVFVAVPIERNGRNIGVLHMSTLAGDIDDMRHEDQSAIINIFLITTLVSLFLSMILAYTIAAPLRKLAEVATQVKIGIKRQKKIPDFSNRFDEIGNLSLALQDMTKALYKRIEDIESFAADVSHELKNPLTSLRSAVETLPITTDAEQQKKLLKIITHDVIRLDRLISDISDASRLDAELARQVPEPVNLESLLRDFCAHDALRCQTTGYQPIQLQVLKANTKNRRLFTVGAHKNRLAQVLANIIDNARSICQKKTGRIIIQLSQTKSQALIEIKDNGRGIDPANLEKIFLRFYTDRPDKKTFGQNSGLGLSIARQIIEAHGGTISAQNIMADKTTSDKIAGACFRIYLPLCKKSHK